jgi:hypothetical protein
MLRLLIGFYLGCRSHRSSISNVRNGICPGQFFADGADRLEAALAKRLDRMTRQIERLERHVTISNETLALFVRFWLTTTPPLPDGAKTAAQAKGRERYDGFIEALGRRLAKGPTLADEVGKDVNTDKTLAVTIHK